MTALADALLAAQRQAIAALSKSYIAGNQPDRDEAGEALRDALDQIGCTDKIEQGYLIKSLEYLRQLGVGVPATPGEAKPDPESQPASDRQLQYISDLAHGLNLEPPEPPLTKAQASQVIEQLKAGTYDPEELREDEDE